MNVERNRLQTFCNWPISAPVDPPRIAKAGFFYTGVGLEVQCFCCQGKINHWDHGDQVMSRHRQMKPNCPFVLNPINTDNIPILDVFESNNTESTHWSEEEPQSDEDNDSSNYGLTEEDELFRCDAMRLLSFINWDGSSARRDALVNAGIYHAGDGRLRCAWCGAELTPYINFGDLQDPIEVHRMYFPRCDHAATVEAAQPDDNFSSSNNLTAPPNVNHSLSCGATHNSRILDAGNTWRALGVVGSGARHANYASLATRLATFNRWPADRTQSPRAMAEAGFFHTGTDDQVRCFYCDGGLGRWEAGDAPWSEHARWFPSCGFVVLVKGPEFIAECRPKTTEQSTVQTTPSNNGSANRPNPSASSPVAAELAAREARIDECMEGLAAFGAFSAGLDVARVRRSILRRLRSSGTSFSTPEELMDAVLDDQLNEEAWSVPTEPRFSTDILAETLRLVAATSQQPEPDRTRTPSPNPTPSINLDQSRQQTNQDQTTNALSQPTNQKAQPTDKRKEREKTSSESSSTSENRSLSLEEENRQLKEARLCKVCMDSEVSVVFLPCGHLVSCAGCGAALAACPLCRQPVRALVRAYLA